MADITILGRSFGIGRYNLGALRKAAPHIDAINAARRESLAASTGVANLEEVMGPVEHIVAIIAIGLVKIDPEFTADYLLENLNIEDMPTLGAALRAILVESGIQTSGEATAPTAPDPAAAGASPTS